MSSSAEVSWRGVIRRDAAWLAMATALSLLAGTVIDFALRAAPLGLAYRPAAQRVVEQASPATAPEHFIDFVLLEDVDALLRETFVVPIDARPREFFELGRLPGARSLSREDYERDFATLEPLLRGKGKSFLVYCSDASCEDSGIVAERLSAAGIGPIHVFAGGMAEWEAAGRPVEAGR